MALRLGKNRLSAGFIRSSHQSRPVVSFLFNGSRTYAGAVTPPDAAALAKLPGIDPSKLEITNATTGKDIVPPEELVFGRTFTGTHRYALIFIS